MDHVGRQRAAFAVGDSVGHHWAASAMGLR